MSEAPVKQALTTERLKQISILTTGQDGEKKLYFEEEELRAFGWVQDEKSGSWNDGKNIWMPTAMAHGTLLYDALSINSALSIGVQVIAFMLPLPSCIR